MPYNKVSDFKEEILIESSKGKSSKEIGDFLKEKYGDFGIKDSSLERQIRSVVHFLGADNEIVVENVRLAKDKQRLQDVQRIERKSFREEARIENAVSAYAEKLVSLYEEYASKLMGNVNINPLLEDGELKGVGVIQLSDIHANELIDLPHNQYNWTILSKRLKKQINESINYFKFKKVRKVLFAVTGDCLNSDRRLDELLNQATNRAKASHLLAHLLIQAIIEVRNAGYEVDVVSVLGNESRISKEMTFSNEAFSDNFDFTIMANVRHVLEFSKIEGVKFHSIDKLELVVQIEDQRWLIMHDMPQATSKQDKTQSIIGKYSLQGKPVDFVISGHIHAHRGTDISCRSGSMAGSNTYNEHALGLIGRASGVCYVVKGKERFYQYIDLQYADNNGYEIISQLEAYNIKSELKTKQQTAILSVVI